MKFFQKAPDGGADSGSTAYFLCEIKPLFSIALLRFEGVREALHNHAFHAVTFWLRGQVREYGLDGQSRAWRAGMWKWTPRSCFHRIDSEGQVAWAISFRGPWQNTWREFRNGAFRTLTHGRREVPNL